MLSERKFLERLRMAAAPRRSELLSDSLDYCITSLSKCWDIKKCKQQLTDYAEFGDILILDGLARFYDFKQIKYFPDSIGLPIINWLYDRFTSVVVVNIFQGYHENLLCDFYAIYNGKDIPLDREIREAMAASYITEGYGISLSSVGTRPVKGQNCILSEKELRVFGKYNFIEI